MNKIIFYDEHKIKVGEVECLNYQLSARYVSGRVWEFPESKYALYLSDDNIEFHLYEINCDGKVFSISIVY